jgi:hypothetical protein
MTGSNGTNHLGVNLLFTKFIFVTPSRDDEELKARLRAAASTVARGYFNDYEGNGNSDSSPQDSVQFLTSDHVTGIGSVTPRYVLQVSSRYRPRLQETEQEFRRRFGQGALIASIEGALRVPQYTSAEMHAYAYKNAASRPSGRAQQQVIILPMRKTQEWWRMTVLERHTYFYPHVGANGTKVKGHATAAEAGVSAIYRRLYYNPDGNGRPGEFDFITYFECADDQLPVFEAVCRSLRDVQQNPEWGFVEEGREWRGRRVLRW